MNLRENYPALIASLLIAIVAISLGVNLSQASAASGLQSIPVGTRMIAKKQGSFVDYKGKTQLIRGAVVVTFVDGDVSRDFSNDQSRCFLMVESGSKPISVSPGTEFVATSEGRFNAAPIFGDDADPTNFEILGEYLSEPDAAGARASSVAKLDCHLDRRAGRVDLVRTLNAVVGNIFDLQLPQSPAPSPSP